jgi:YVTN family beta-propeller protein
VVGCTKVQTTPGYLSPESIIASQDGRVLYLAEATGQQVVMVDAISTTVTQTVRLDAPPTGLALAGKQLIVTAGGVYTLDASDLRVLSRLDAGHTPTAPVVSPDGSTLYVCNQFNDDVALYDLPGRKEIARIPVTREPVAAALTPDGKTLFVANHLPAGAASADYVAAVVSVIDTGTRKVAGTIPLPNGSTSLKGICLSPDGRYAYVTHTLSRYQLPTTQLERGWMNTSAVTVMDVAARKPLTTFLVDEVDLGAANPWGIAVTADGKQLCLTHAGTHELSVIDRTALHAKLAKLVAGQRVSEVAATLADVPNDLSFLVGLRRRVKLPGNGPRGLALAGNSAYVAEYFTDTLAVVPLAGQPASVALGPKLPLTPERRGEIAFHDAAHCFQHWQSCASCHPGNARVDALNWDLLNDGIGNPKNTRTMLLAHVTPPVMTFSVRAKAEVAVRAGFRHIQFTIHSEEHAAAVDAYLKSLKPVPSPARVKGKLSASARRGEKAFQTAGCAECHPAPLYTDLKSYDLATTTGLDAGRPVDTPTLVECWRTAPYLHDGSAATLRDVVTTHNPHDKHGKTSRLSAAEINDLIEYLRSLQ